MKREINVIKKDWRTIDLSVGLIYPNIYMLGISSYSIRLLYSIINSYENVACERIFLPEHMRFPASKDITPEHYIRSIENGIHPIEFDILGFSIHFENDFRNILWLLEKSNIPLSREERMKRRENKKEYYPLIIGGGPVATSNPLPLNSIFDVFFLGDAEPLLEEFFQLFLTFKGENLSFEQLLIQLSAIEGLYIPILNNIPKRKVLFDLDEFEIPPFQLITSTKNTTGGFEESFFIEVNRGCPFECKFCISSFHNRPFRNHSFESITTTLNTAVNNFEFPKVSLIGSCVSAHPEFFQICQLVLEKHKKLAVPSIRIDHITQNILNILGEAQLKTITIAPEAGSEFLRYTLGKKVSDNLIFQKLKEIKNSSIKNVKMYFLIGLPEETEDDIESLITMIKRCDEFAFQKNALRININPMVPKMNTPFQKNVFFFKKKNQVILKERFHKIKKALGPLKSVRLKIGDINTLINNAYMQTLFSLGDRKLSKVLIDYYRQGATYGVLKRVMAQSSLSGDLYLSKIEEGYTPWIIQ
ncbi:MAG: hypothetical protein BAJALOKI1v1_1390006 [Promethearchaeota archaeon]|nr:MAG: hypothetical protein BAJALOKI1v1_1390006 [Candidatus Lokiarchaeota archaeon]